MFRHFLQNRTHASYLWNALVILVSSFLLFEIQFIAGKHFLPEFGGSSGVWAASLLFFTTLLFLGYTYVFALSRLRVRNQIFVHTALSIVAVLGVAYSLIYYQSLFELGVMSAEVSPYIRILVALSLSVGLPYFLLSSTSPLLQFWYGLSSAKEPYTLYAISNVGSALALLSYPFVLEPLFTLSVQEYVWAALFCVVACASVALGIVHYKASSHHAQKAPVHAEEGASSQTLGTYAVWILGGAFPSFLLVATTTQITEELAPVPLLWMLPLFLYLLSFILAFSGRGSGYWYPFWMFLAAIGAFLMLDAHSFQLISQILAYLVLLFFAGVVCHSAVYAKRPSTHRLPLFYLSLSLGGALGALAGSIIAPLVFTHFYEFPLSVALSAIVAALLLSPLYFPRIMSERTIRYTKLLFIVIVVAYASHAAVRGEEAGTITSRNFYGAASIVLNTQTTILMHGTTMHGLQLNDAASKRLPTTYYTQGSGAGRALAYARDSRGANLNVGVLGLGTGTLAAYCESGDTFVFYEIDRRMIALAHQYFSYLSQCEGVSVREGDGRLLLEHELANNTPGQYDVLIVDAFSNDKVPAHLLTLEAVFTYGAHLRDQNSILAIHVSSKYLNIAPVVLRLAEEAGFSAIVVNEAGATELASPSRWVLLSKNPDVFTSVIFAQSNDSETPADAPLWTDSYTSIVPMLFIPELPDLVFWD